MDAGLTDTGVLLTGASGGIGLAAARAFAAEGCRLALHYHRNREPLETLGGDILGRGVALQADVRCESDVRSLVEQAVAALGRVDVLVANAGIWIPQATPLAEMSLAQWNITVETDLTGTFLVCREFLKHLATVPRQSAAIVLVGSTAALFGEAGHADYAAAKAGIVHGLTATLKNEIIEVAPRGRVNCVCPGWTDTPMAAACTADPQAVARATATMALAKIADPNDVAAAIVFLASDRLAGHISGAVVPVAGGMEGRVLRPA